MINGKSYESEIPGAQLGYEINRLGVFLCTCKITYKWFCCLMSVYRVLYKDFVADLACTASHLSWGIENAFGVG